MASHLRCLVSLRPGPQHRRRVAIAAQAFGQYIVRYVVLRYNVSMPTARATAVPVAQLKTLAEFRHRLRLFLQFSENAAQKLGLQPQQHQLLLQIAGAPDGTATTVGYVAERLGLRHNTAVELSNRCEEAGLIKRCLLYTSRCV